MIKLQDISNFNKISDYIPIFNGALLADIIVLYIVYYTSYFNSKYLMKWYETYRLSAIIADVFILIIGIIIARYIYYYIFNIFSVIKFTGLVVVIQIIHDILFYLFFKSIPRGTNLMFDMFKDYAKEVNSGAIIGDSFMIIIATLASMLFANISLNSNIIWSICLIYLIPYILYTR